MTTIGQSLFITGEITSYEDVAIDGHVDGLVTVRDATLTIGPGAHVEGNVRAPRIVVAGSVRGGIAATERIDVRASAVVNGSLSSVQVVMADGATFNGGIDMAQRTIAAKVAQFKAAAK